MAVWVAFILSTLAVYISFAEGTENFNVETHICCNGTVSKKGPTSGCCGKEAYDVTVSACCGDKVVPLPEGPGGPSGHGCCYGPSGSALPYDMDTHECCYGSVLEKPDKESHYGCCAGGLYDYRKDLCCDDKILERHAGDECCGSKVYNISLQVCCEQWGLKEEQWAKEYSEVFDRKGEHTFCCGRGVYDAGAEVCCNDKAVTKPAHVGLGSAGCCGDAVYDFLTQLCCQDYKNISGVLAVADSKVLDKVGPGSSCCGMTAYDHYTGMCCGDTVRPKPDGMDNEAWGACCGDQVMTSYETQLCDNGKILERNGSTMFPCGKDGKLFDVTKQSCCFGKVLNDADGLACCHLASKPYNQKKENCCGDQVVPLTDEDVAAGKMACCAPLPNFLTFITPARP